jgi:soluble lytic murein transglycosylase-like protein
MVNKVDTAFFPGTLPSHSPSTRQGQGIDFHSIVKEKMKEAIPLENQVLEFLRKAIESALLETKPEEVNLSLPPSLPLPPKPPLAQKWFSSPSSLEGRNQTGETDREEEMSANLPATKGFESIVREAGEKHGVDSSLIQAVIQVESNGYPLAISKSGAQGLMQLMPETAAQLGVTDPFDPAENIMAGTHYLRLLLDRYGGNLKLALAAYNWGMGNLEKRPEAMPDETKNYIAKVETRYRNNLKP